MTLAKFVVESENMLDCKNVGSDEKGEREVEEEEAKDGLGDKWIVSITTVNLYCE